MGNIVAKREEDLIEGGFAFPTGTVYQKIDCDLRIVSKFITELKVSPFYKGLPDPQDDRASVECPICFLYYPPNINVSRCCNQPLCSECFVQIKQPKTGGPATCPFCVQPDFGIIYTPPSKLTPPTQSGSLKKEKTKFVPLPPNSPNVVTTDAIRPNGRHYPPPKETESGHLHVRRMTVSGRPSSSRASNARRSHGQPTSSSFTGTSAAYPVQSVRIQSPSRFTVRDVEAELEHMMLLEAIHLSLMEQEREKERQEAAEATGEHPSPRSQRASFQDVGSPSSSSFHGVAPLLLDEDRGGPFSQYQRPRVESSSSDSSSSEEERASPLANKQGPYLDRNRLGREANAAD